MFALVDVLNKIVGALSSIQRLVLRVGNSHVKHARKTDVLIEALMSKAGNRGIHVRDISRRFAGLESLLTDEYMITSTTVYNGRMEVLDLESFKGLSGGQSIYHSLTDKLKANGWSMYLSLHEPADFGDDFPVNGVWIKGR